MMKSFTHTVMGELDAAEQLQQQAAAIAEETGRPYDRVAAAYSGGWLKLGRNEPAAAAAILEDGFVLAQKHGIRLFVPVLACHLGMAYLEQGLFDRARGMLAEAREEAKAVGYTSAVRRSWIYLALTTWRLGDVQAAQNMLREARNTARQQGFSGLEAEALFRRGRGDADLWRREQGGRPRRAARHDRDRHRERCAAAPAQGRGDAERAAGPRRRADLTLLPVGPAMAPPRRISARRLK